jgi:tetratricopeptide (TPR) repeat protein
MASAVLGTQVSAQLLWQVAELEVQAGIEALEEAVKSGLLREEQGGTGRRGRYRFAHDLIRDVVYTELGAARRQVLHQRALARLQAGGAPAAELAYHALLAGEDERAARYSIQAGDEALAVFAVADAIGYYEQVRALLQEHQPLQTMISASEVEHLYVSLGWAYAFQNAWQQAQEALEELLAYARQKPLPTLVSMTLNRLAILAVQQSKDKLQMRALLEEAWQRAEASQDQRALAETEWNLAVITAVVWEDPKSAFPHGQQALSLARGIQDKELEARSLAILGYIHIREGDFQEAMPCLEAALALYAALGTEPTASRELSLPSFLNGAPLTQPLTNRATEALYQGLLALAQLHAGQMHNSLGSGRRALALAQESKNVWVEVISTFWLTYGLLDAGAYEEALMLTQHAVVLARRTLPRVVIWQDLLTALGSTYQALQQWEEARSILEEVEVVAETLGLGPYGVPALSQLCAHYALAGEWEAAYRYAMKAIAVRKRSHAALIVLDFSQQYETEVLLCGGDERQAREAVQRLGECVGPYRRFRIVYLRSLATLAAWEGRSEQAIGHLQEAGQLAADLGLPGERWQIEAVLGRVYAATGEPEQAHTAFGEAARIIGGLAEGIKDETLRSRFLAGPQIHPVLQQAQSEASPVPQDQAEQSGAPRRLVLQADEPWEAL